jgi:cytochrome c biogenesis protein
MQLFTYSINKIWKFFASIKLAVFLFLIIALSSIIGTVIEQNVEDAKNFQLFIRLFGEELGPNLFSISKTLEFMNMYQSWWFTVFLVLFGFNILTCSIERLPAVWKRAKKPIHPIKTEAFQRLPGRQEVTLKGSLNDIKKKVIDVIKSQGFTPFESNSEEGIQLYAHKGQYTRLGVYIVHLSVILILVGAIVGNVFGFKGYLNLPEGTKANYYYTRDGGMKIPLGFSIACNWFEVEYYKDSHMPKSYKSDLVIMENGRPVKNKVIEVNDPLIYKGVYFYQSTFGMVPRAEGTIILDVMGKNGEKKRVKLKKGEEFTIPGSSLKGEIVEFSPALGYDAKTETFFTYDENMLNPAVYVRFKNGNEVKYAGWILKRVPDTGLLPEKYRITLIDNRGIEFTGLQVRKDPGVWLVYLGCITMAVGLFMALFMSHRKLWVYVNRKKNSTVVTFTGRANKNSLSFEKDIEKMKDRLIADTGGKKIE